MDNSVTQFKHLLRVALLALPLLLLLGLNGRTVTLLRPVTPAGTQASETPRATTIRQRVMLEAASPLAHYVAPAALAWLPLPAAWAAPRLRRAVAAASLGAPAAFVAQLCRQRLLSAALAPQAP